MHCACVSKVFQNKTIFFQIFQGILQGIYWGLGTGIGAILGGVLINHYGIVLAYRLGGIATVLVTLYFVVSQWLVKKYDDSADMSIDEDKKLVPRKDNDNANEHCITGEKVE